MRIVAGDVADRATTQACYEIIRDMAEVDDPDGPPWSQQRIRGWLEFPNEPAEVWLAVDEATGEYLGWNRLVLPDQENLDRATVWGGVRPVHRGRGIGTALLRHAAGRAAAEGRSVLVGDAFDGSAGAAFAARLGATPGQAEARRVQVLSEIPAGRIAALRAAASRAADGYSIVRWDGRTPEEYVARAAELENAMADAPHDAGDEPAVWDADRYRREIDDAHEARGRHVYTLAALHDASGEMAAITAVEPDLDSPTWGHQAITAVIRKHRGHRLGLLVKTTMLEWLAEAEPQLERVLTYNAAANEHMVAINEELGYRLLEPLSRAYELPVADALAATAATTARG